MALQLARREVAAFNTPPKVLIKQARRDGIERLVVRAIIEDESGGILLLKRRDDKFRGGVDELPGGGVELGERPRQALRRELREELGSDFEIYSHAPFVYSHDGVSKNGLPVRSLIFAVTVKGDPEITINPEEHVLHRSITFGDMLYFNVEPETTTAVLVYNYQKPEHQAH